MSCKEHETASVEGAQWYQVSMMVSDDNPITYLALEPVDDLGVLLLRGFHFLGQPLYLISVCRWGGSQQAVWSSYSDGIESFRRRILAT